MEEKQYYAMIEAVLFASGEPLSLGRLAEALELDEMLVSSLLPNLMERYRKEDHGIEIVCLDGMYQMCTKPQWQEPIRRAIEMKKNTPLSQAAMETLAIIAYNEPVTKSFIEQVRGVDSSSIVNSLAEKGLIEEAGRLEVPGRPIAYRTSIHFLRSFQLKDLSDLPPLPDQEEKLEEISES
jgi:segregation and condensation protein B